MKDDIMSVSEQEKVRLFQCERRKEIMLAVTAVIVAEHFFMVVTIILVLYYGAYHIREHKNGKILRVMLGYITFSKECKCGSICTDGTDRDLDALLQRADEKMYKNKQKMKRKRRTI